ncbi:relaxase/mobilization nuclease domain-containing protein [Kineococcus sp. SYSU DK003]|uniref:relaxase/mobilization nuclease domain-containing protein n=1 Tax=Kineococcus sp. SYSU DK003 TaxID=3383124 RepID=UPI003D7E2794
MAYVKMHQIKKTPALSIKYIVRSDATDDGRLVSTNAAVLDPADWQATAVSWEKSRAKRTGAGRQGDVLAHHIVQSFKPGEISSPAQAHDIGVQLAEQIVGGRFEYTVATHLDKGHVHNHILVNAYSHVDGHKIRVQRDTLARYRGISDDLCRAQNLSIIPAREERSLGETLGQRYARARGKSATDLVKLAIDNAVGNAKSWREFETALNAQGIEVGRSQKRHVTFKGFEMSRAVRDVRLGVGYTEDVLMARLGQVKLLRFDADRSLIAAQKDGVLTLKLPGSGGQRRVNVDQSQVVEHGRTLRVYLPAEGRQAILDRRGQISAQVPTRALYGAFAPPARDLLKTYQQPESAVAVRRGRQAQAKMTRLHDQESVLNVRARYGVVTARQAVSQAVQLHSEIDKAQQSVQTFAVALDNLTDKNGPEAADLRVRLSAAQHDVNDLSRSAASLASWAVTVERESESLLRDMSLKERLRGLQSNDLVGVGLSPRDANELTQQLDRRTEDARQESVTVGKEEHDVDRSRAEAAKQQEQQERPATWEHMTLGERMAWLREHDAAPQRTRKPTDGNENGRERGRR